MGSQAREERTPAVLETPAGSRATCVRPLPPPHVCARSTPPYSRRPATGASRARRGRTSLRRGPPQSPPRTPATEPQCQSALLHSQEVKTGLASGAAGKPVLAAPCGGCWRAGADSQTRGCSGACPHGAHLLSGASRHQWGRSCGDRPRPSLPAQNAAPAQGAHSSRDTLPRRECPRQTTPELGRGPNQGFSPRRSTPNAEATLLLETPRPPTGTSRSPRRAGSRSARRPGGCTPTTGTPRSPSRGALLTAGPCPPAGSTPEPGHRPGTRVRTRLPRRPTEAKCVRG